MIIDIHRHVVAKEWFSDGFWRGFARMALPILTKMGVQATVDMVVNTIFPLTFDTDGQKHVAQMEQAGIDKGVFFAFDNGMLVGEPVVDIEEQNKTVFRMARRYPDRVIPFATIDPRRPRAREFVRKCVEESGAKGLKLHPGAGFNPEGKATLDLVESIARYEIPVLVHTGPSIPPTSSRYCDPIYLDEMLLRFPEVQIIAAHMSYGYRLQLFSLGTTRPNLHTDVAAWQTMARDHYPQFARTLRDAADNFGPERVLFGSDNPYLWPVMPEADYVQAVKDLATKAPEDERFTDTEIGMILGGNARNLLKL